MWEKRKGREGRGKGRRERERGEIDMYSFQIFPMFEGFICLKFAEVLLQLPPFPFWYPNEGKQSSIFLLSKHSFRQCCGWNKEKFQDITNPNDKCIREMCIIHNKSHKSYLKIIQEFNFLCLLKQAVTWS